jgi:hypothetical protein
MGNEIRKVYLLTQIGITCSGLFYRNYAFDYSFDGQYSFIKEINETGNDGFTKLNSTKFKLHTSQSLNTVETTGIITLDPPSLEKEIRLRAVDMNADGLSDIIMEKPNKKWSEDDVESTFSLANNIGNNTFTLPIPIGTSFINFEGGPYATIQNFNYDWDLDGKPDVTMQKIIPGQVFGFANSSKGRTISDLAINYNTANSFSLPLVQPLNSILGYSHVLLDGSQFTTDGDFDGDNLPDKFIFGYTEHQILNWLGFMEHEPAKQGFLILSSNNYLPIPVTGFPFEQIHATLGLITFVEPVFLSPVDFDGDGKNELALVIYDSPSALHELHIIKFDPNNNWNGTDIFQKVVTLVDKSLLLGDFNGDGITDYLDWKLVGSNRQWYPNYGTGTNYYQGIAIQLTDVYSPPGFSLTFGQQNTYGT